MGFGPFYNSLKDIFELIVLGACMWAILRRALIKLEDAFKRVVKTKSLENKDVYIYHDPCYLGRWSYSYQHCGFIKRPPVPLSEGLIFIFSHSDVLISKSHS